VRRGICFGCKIDSRMIYACFPLGTIHGWGVAGRMIVQEMARRTPVQFFSSDPLQADLVEDELELEFLRSLLPPAADPLQPNLGHAVEGPVLRGIPAIGAQACPQLRGPWNVGYTFFENDVEAARHWREAFGEFDLLVAGCSWCADVLRQAGHPNVTTIIQGINPEVFHPRFSEKQYLLDKFVVFSGGKLEFRKGQDIVIRAMQVMQQRHADVMFVCSWFNRWSQNAATIGHSRLIRVPALSGDFIDVTKQLLAANGLDLSRVMVLGPRRNSLMARIYRNSDVGLFPNRCEGGTNLVLMEYMACGKPVVAAYNSGQCDVVSDNNARLIRKMSTFTVGDQNNDPVANWFEPDLDETIEHLEWAYQHRDDLRALGERAGADMATRTWGHCAEEFIRVLMK
jgi:glycosyltransferase involved in cell wall biosynthesis